MDANLSGKFDELSPEAVAYLRGVGEALREARQRRGRDIHRIAGFLRIKPAYLYALENAEYEVFPGRAYAYGFLRSYADYLGFDGGEVVRRVKAACEKPLVPPPEPEARRRRLYVACGAAAFGVIVALLLVAGQTDEADLVGPFGGRMPFAAKPGDSAASGASVPALPATAGNDPAGSGLPSTAEGPDAPEAPRSAKEAEGATRSLAAAATSALPEKLSASEQVPHVGGDGPLPTTPVTGAAAQAAADPSAAVAAEVPDRLLMPASPAPVDVAARSGAARVVGRSFGSADGSRFRLVAHEPSWVQIRSRDGTYVRTRTLEPGDRYYLPPREDLVLWAGNAGGIELIYDDRSLGIVGAPGTIARDISLAPPPGIADADAVR